MFAGDDSVSGHDQPLADSELVRAVQAVGFGDIDPPHPFTVMLLCDSPERVALLNDI